MLLAPTMRKFRRRVRQRCAWLVSMYPGSPRPLQGPGRSCFSCPTSLTWSMLVSLGHSRKYAEHQRRGASQITTYICRSAAACWLPGRCWTKLNGSSQYIAHWCVYDWQTLFYRMQSGVVLQLRCAKSSSDSRVGYEVLPTELYQ